MAIDKLILRPNAKLRFLEVLAFYTDIDENLGRRFNEQVEKCLNYIKDNPYLFVNAMEKLEFVILKHSHMQYSI